MDISYQPEESNDLLTELMPTEDQLFLLYFIMGTYFGPDLKHEMVKKSALQRMAEGLPPYTSGQLANTHTKSVEVERIYYHVLRKADQSVPVKLPLLHHFLGGNIHSQIPEPHIMYPQFPNLFPLKLHPQSRSKEGNKVIENIVVINNPDVYYIEPANVERFKRLTGLDDFVLSRDAATTHSSTVGGGLYNVSVHEADYETSKKMRSVGDIMDTTNHFHDVHVVAPISSVSHDGGSMSFNLKPLEEFEPAMIFLPSRPNMNEWQNIVAATRSGFGLTGCAAKGQVGSVIGLMDIGECENSYIFRISLPGVKRDGKAFSCLVEIDGKVLIRGVTTTGEKRVHRHSQTFEMQTQNLCPPGNFSISFQLPGPVDPLKFSGNFGTDGILEGIVFKDEQRNH